MCDSGDILLWWVSAPYGIVIVYGPTSSRCMADPTLCDQFYQQLEVAIDLISEKRPIIIVMGEMNGKVGKRKVGDA